MKKIIRIPYLGTNDIDCILASWNVTAGESVTKGQVVCTLETTKTTFDIESDEAGFFYPLSDQGNTLKHHAPLGLLSDEIVDQPDQILSEIISQSEEKEKTLSPVMTKKAEILIVKNGLSQEQINQLYATAHFVLLPSKSEGWPKVLSEGMAFGAVPLATAVGSIPSYLVQFGTGMALREATGAAFAGAVRTYNTERWQRESLAALSSAALFSYEHYLETVLMMLEK